MKDILIAIDPDTDKSGVAILNLKTKDLTVFAMPFPNLCDFLKDASHVVTNTIVLVEAGWKIKTNWHLNSSDNRRTASAKGNSAGRNHETGRKIVEMCKHYGLNTEEVLPLRKCWKGLSGKITHDEISAFIPNFPRTSNQEIRDAVLIAWHYAGYPIRINPVRNDKVTKMGGK